MGLGDAVRLGDAVGETAGDGDAPGDSDGEATADADGASDRVATGDGEPTTAAPASDAAGLTPPPPGDCVRAITRTVKARTIRPTSNAWPPLRAEAPGRAPMRRAGSRTRAVDAVAGQRAAPSSPGARGMDSTASAVAAR